MFIGKGDTTVRTSRLIIATLLLIAPIAVNAAPSVYTDASGIAVTSIQNFEFEGSTFDISFVTGSFDDVFGTDDPPVPPPFFLGDELTAHEFVDAIAMLLNAGLGCRYDLCAYVGELDNLAFLVPFELFDIDGDTFVTSAVGAGNGAGLWFPSDLSGDISWPRFLEQSNYWALIETVSPDSDNDGVLDDDDFCPNTIIPESVPTRSLGVNHFALFDGDNTFDTTSPQGEGPDRSYTTADTAGCSCTQIIEAQGLGNGHTKFGCSISAMDDWIELVTP